MGDLCRFITEINKRGKLLLQELNDICNKKKMQLSSKNEELMALSLKLAQCHKFAEAAINRGSDVALVFSKRTICNQVGRMTAIQRSLDCLRSLLLGSISCFGTFIFS